ncbi:MAG: hypothetical protein GY832_01155 [Chloroflexi bacterium]|nr:hypothetical protein [Chloroflexota bacterium]
MKTLRNLFLLGILVLLISCTTLQPPHYTIGIVNPTFTLNDTVEAFKAGMAEFGYIEGENVTYIYQGPADTDEKLDAAIQDVIAADVDLILSLLTATTVKVKQAAEGTNIPVIFVPVADPVGFGLVNSLREPGGNLTGIMLPPGGTSKGLEWLLKIVPGLERIYVPIKPDDKSQARHLANLQEAAARVDIEIVIAEARTADEANAVLNTIPANVDAIWELPSSFWSPHVDQFILVSLEQKLPLRAAGNWIERGALMSYAGDNAAFGRQASRMADKIMQGVEPANLPVETADFFLSINLQTANAIGIHIPDSILEQADNIIR